MTRKKQTDDKCIPEWEEHQGLRDTGKRGVNKLTGHPFQVWACQCGAKTLEVFPHLKKK